MGVKFTSEVFGSVTGVRFYKAAANTGTHVGSLWSESGTLLASATFTSETASGWQQVNFSTPVQISPNTTYVVGYLAPKGHYSADSYYFYSPSPTGPKTLNSPPLHAVPASATTSNGLYSYATTSTFPTSTYNGTNYWVDPVFSPAAPPGQVTGVSATAGAGSARISWSAPTSGGVVTTYTVTPYIGIDRADAHDGERIAAGAEHNDLRSHARHDIHLQGAGLQPQRVRTGVGGLEPGDAADICRARSAERRVGKPGDRAGARELDGADRRRRQRRSPATP